MNHHGTSARSFPFGGSGLGSIIASLMSSQGLGEPVASGKDQIMSALKAHYEKAGEPFDGEGLSEMLDQNPDAQLYLSQNGQPMIISAEPLNDFPGLGLGGFGERHRNPGGSTHGFTDAFEELFGRQRQNDRRQKSPLEQFAETVLDVNKPERKKPERPMAIELSLATMAAASEVGRYPVAPSSKASVMAEAFAKMVNDCEIANPVKFKNLGGYLDSYSVSLRALAERARQFARDPRNHSAENLSRDLALANIALVNSYRDAVDKAAKLAAEAKNI